MGRWHGALDALRDPKVLLGAAAGGALAWAVHVPVPLDVVVAGGMLGVASVTGAVTGRRAVGSSAGQPKPIAGTPQASILAAIDRTLVDLAGLRDSATLPAALADPATSALAAGQSARSAASRAALALDGLDTAIERTRSMATGANAAQVTVSLGRMRARQKELGQRLDKACADVQGTYAKLLELSVTVDDSSGVDVSGLDEVNDRLDALRQAFGELNAGAASARAELPPGS